jgi:hypothetical protein
MAVSDGIYGVVKMDLLPTGKTAPVRSRVGRI